MHKINYKALLICGSMYSVTWDSEINGILLTTDGTSEKITPPQPVFFEELNLLGFDKYWNYPESNYPLLWSVNRRYYYKGNHVATASKGDALNLPELQIKEGYKNLTLDEIDIKKVIERNSEALFVLENEAIDFIENTYDRYPNCPFSVSFSGGKDSQAVLDLVTRVIPAHNITIIFSDTTLEHEFTYETVDCTISKYEQENPNLKFLKAKPKKSATELFGYMGLPSRFNRWCTPILKTAPYNKLINSLVESDSKIIVFEGVRSDESPRRSKYKRIADGVKHPSIINTRPILHWNFSEVFLYNYYRDLPINPLYRYGLRRVGCELCPFSSDWSECIVSHINENFRVKYTPLIKDYAKNRGLSNEKDLDKFISGGEWKKRAGGLGINPNSSITFSQSLNNFKSILTNPTENFLEWVKVLGNLSYEEKNNEIKGEIDIDDNYINFSLKKKDNKEIIDFNNIQNNVQVQSKIKKVLKKSAFCVHCGVCEVECEKNAIVTHPIISINSNLCINCGNCINFTGDGCYRAKSLKIGDGGNNMRKKTTGIDKYSTFGLREEWLEEFFDLKEKWLDDNILGPKQVPAVVNWLSEAGLMDSKSKKPTKLGNDLNIIYKNDPLFVWGIIWVNLYYNSKVINWYCDTINWGMTLSKSELLETIMESFPNLSKGTLNNAISAMINMFDNSPYGNVFNLGEIEKKGRAVKSVSKNGAENDIDNLLIAYSLYKLSENMNRTDFTVSEIYDENFEGGPYNLFGISQKQLERILRGLQQSGENILKADLVADLDNIFLDKTISSYDLIKIKMRD